jgi:hypothetical protein
VDLGRSETQIAIHRKAYQIYNEISAKYCIEADYHKMDSTDAGWNPNIWTCVDVTRGKQKIVGWDTTQAWNLDTPSTPKRSKTRSAA